jgi:SH3-like domain-containing protein
MTGTSLISWLEGPIRSSCVLGRRTAVLVALGAILMGASAARAANDAGSGLAVPRFVSLKSDKVNVRAGPTKDNDVAWIYTRAGLPVEITAEYENWRRVRDWEGAEGWVYHSLLSGRRTGLIQPNAKINDEFISVYASADTKSAVTARLQRGVLGKVKHCTGTWCRITGEGFDGWVEQERLWGVYPNEKIE